MLEFIYVRSFTCKQKKTSDRKNKEGIELPIYCLWTSKRPMIMKVITKLWEVPKGTNFNPLPHLWTLRYSDMKFSKKKWKQQRHTSGISIFPTSIEQWKKKWKEICIQIDEDSYRYTLHFADDHVICTNDKEAMP